MSARLITTVVATTTMLVGACSSPSSQTARTATTAMLSSIDPTRSATQRPAASTAADPLSAAIAFVASTDELMGHSPIGRREIFRKLVAPGAVEEQVAAFEEAATQLATTLKIPVERLVWVEAPVTAMVVDRTDSSASVDVWTVSILGAPDTGSPQQVWRTVHVDLQLVTERWLVASAGADAGPTPAANELAMQAGWKQFEVVSSWPAVVEGVGL